MRGPLPPWSLELWGRAAGHWAKWLERRRPLRPDRPTAKDRGQAPRRWLWSSRGWPVSGQDAGPGRLRAGSPTRSLPRGNGPHPGHIRPASQGPWGRVPWNWKLSPPPRGPILFPWTPLASPSPTPPEAECQGRTRDLGPGTGACHGSGPGGAGPGRRDPTHGPGLPWGLGLVTCPGGESLSWLKRPHPAPRRQICNETLLLSKVWAELCEKGLCGMRPGSHRARTPPPCEGIRGLWSLVCAKGIHLRRTWAQVSGTRPRGRSLGRPLEPRGPGLGIFPGALSGPRLPLLPREGPRRPLTPAGRLHPSISSPPPPWSWDTWGLGASNGPTWRQTRRPLRPVLTTAKIPLFFHP